MGREAKRKVADRADIPTVHWVVPQKYEQMWHARGMSSCSTAEDIARARIAANAQNKAKALGVVAQCAKLLREGERTRPPWHC